jgi:hypothetical protein
LGVTKIILKVNVGGRVKADGGFSWRSGYSFGGYVLDKDCLASLQRLNLAVLPLDELMKLLPSGLAKFAPRLYAYNRSACFLFQLSYLGYIMENLIHIKIGLL